MMTDDAPVLVAPEIIDALHRYAPTELLARLIVTRGRVLRILSQAEVLAVEERLERMAT